MFIIPHKKQTVFLSMSFIASVLLHAILLSSFYYKFNDIPIVNFYKNNKPLHIQMQLQKNNAQKKTDLSPQTGDVKIVQNTKAKTINEKKLKILKYSDKINITNKDPVLKSKVISIDAINSNSKSEAPIAKTSIKNEITINHENENPFGELSIPVYFLGQNLFPRIYKVTFIMEWQNSHLIFMKIKNMEAKAVELAYLDRTMRKLFSKRVSEILDQKNSLIYQEMVNWLKKQRHSDEDNLNSQIEWSTEIEFKGVS